LSTIQLSDPTIDPKLTPREQDLVRAILDGLSNKEIAARLGISVQTVKNGLGPVFDKYRVSSRLELAIRASTKPS
jgi:DNA-binding NarL/FixJ family response regulator